MNNLKFNKSELLDRTQLRTILGGSNLTHASEEDKGWKCCVPNSENCSRCTGGWICSAGYVAVQCV